MASIGLALTAVAASAQDKAPPEEPKSQPSEDKAPTADVKLKLPPYYTMLANQADLDDAQRQKLAEATAKRRAAHDEWAPKVQQLQKQLAEIYAKQRQIEADFATSLREIIRKEQRVAWETAKLFSNVKMGLGMKQITLDDKQQEKIKQLCGGTAEAISKLAPADGQAQGRLLQELQVTIARDLLTPEQQAKLRAPPKPQAKKNAPPPPK